MRAAVTFRGIMTGITTLLPATTLPSPPEPPEMTQRWAATTLSGRQLRCYAENLKGAQKLLYKASRAMHDPIQCPLGCSDSIVPVGPAATEASVRSVWRRTPTTSAKPIGRNAPR
jgi:hypothetical protein